MYAGDGNLTASGRFANFSAPRAIYLRHRICQREWRDLDAVVADSSGVRKDVFDLPAFEDFVANGEAHGSAESGFRAFSSRRMRLAMRAPRTLCVEFPP